MNLMQDILMLNYIEIKMFNILFGGLLVIGSLWYLRSLLFFLLENLGAIVLGDFMKKFHFNYTYIIVCLGITYLGFLTFDVYKNNKSLYLLARIELENQTRGGEDYISTHFKDSFNLQNCKTIFKDDSEISKECELLENKINKTVDK